MLVAVTVTTTKEPGDSDAVGEGVAVSERVGAADALELWLPERVSVTVTVCVTNTTSSDAEIDADGVTELLTEVLTVTVRVTVAARVTVTTTYAPLRVGVSERVADKGAACDAANDDDDDCECTPPCVTVTVRVCCTQREKQAMGKAVVMHG